MGQKEVSDMVCIQFCMEELKKNLETLKICLMGRWGAFTDQVPNLGPMKSWA